MSTKNIAASFVLALLFVSLIAIYLVTLQDPRVTSICVILLAMSLFITIDGSWREVGIVGGLGALVSLVAAALLGRAYFGSVGGTVLTIGWGLVVLLVFRWISSNIVRAPSDRAVIITNVYTGNTYRAGFPNGEPPLGTANQNGSTPSKPGERRGATGEPIAPPIFPLLERKVATVPLYELDQEIRVEKINVQQGHNITALTVQVRYQIVNWQSALSGIPNRGQGQIEFAKQVNKNLEDARNDPVFWEKLFARQMESDVSDTVRDVVFATQLKAADVYKKRITMEENKPTRLSDMVREQLREEIGRWGAAIISLDIDQIEVEGDRFSDTNPTEKEAKRVELIRKAENQAEAERVQKLIELLQSKGVALTPALIADIVVTSIESVHEWGLDHTYDSIASIPGSPSGGPPNTKK